MFSLQRMWRVWKGVFYLFLSIKACVCQGIDRNESRAPVIYRTIAQLINLMNHIIHPIIHKTCSTTDHWRSISCSCEGQERLKVCTSLTRPELALFHIQRLNTRLVVLWIFHAVQALSIHTYYICEWKIIQIQSRHHILHNLYLWSI